VPLTQAAEATPERAATGVEQEAPARTPPTHWATTHGYLCCTGDTSMYHILTSSTTYDRIACLEMFEHVTTHRHPSTLRMQQRLPQLLRHHKNPDASCNVCEWLAFAPLVRGHA